MFLRILINCGNNPITNVTSEDGLISMLYVGHRIKAVRWLVITNYIIHNLTLVGRAFIL